MRRLLPLLVLAALVGVSLLVAMRWGRPRLVARAARGIATSVAGDGASIAWIEQGADGSRLWVKKGRGRARQLLAGKVIGGLAVAGGRAFATVADAPGGAATLRSFPLGGGPAKDVATISALASQIVVSDGWIFWLAGSEPALPAAPFLAAAGPVSAIGAAPEKGGSPALIAGLLNGGRAEIVGLADGNVYWAQYQRRAGQEATLILRRAVKGGPTDVLVEELGRRSAALSKGRLAWTAPSQEAAPPNLYASVKVMPLSGGEAEVVADWLGPGARLLSSGDGLYAQDSECLWRVGGGRGTQRIVYDRSYGGESPSIVGANEFLVASPGRERALIERGVTWAEKLRQALRPGA